MKGAKPHAIVKATNTLTATPKAPAWLSPDAKAEWRRVAPILVARKVLTEADLGTLESYCTATGTVREAQRKLNADGLTVDTPTGPKRHPVLGIQNAAMATARQCACELGLTPYSRSRSPVRDTPDDDDESPLDLE